MLDIPPTSLKMSTCTYNCFMNVINIGNSIIGVSILAMPYCFRKCGILLSVVLIFISGVLTRTACYLLLKSAIMARRRNFEFLAFHTFGTTGKLAVEVSVVGFLIGVCIAFFVVIGDLGPPLASEFLAIENSPNLRTNILMLVGLCVALPLGMLRKIDSLTSLSALSIAFYVCLILKIFSEAVPNLAANEWWYEVNWWKSEGILPCLPIFSMALSCQTQLFEFFDTSNDPSLKRMQSVVAGAVHLCSTVYIMVGILGYIAFHDKSIHGNILVLLTPSMITEFIKLGFILTVAVSFPLCLFPCRSSLHSLIFKQGFGHHDTTITAIPELRFRILTVSLVIVTIGISIMVPNIEFVLGIIGSTIGTLICLIFPALMFIHDTSKNTTEKRMAQFLVGIGFFILIACTYSTLQDVESKPEPVIKQVQNIIKITESNVMISAPLELKNILIVSSTKESVLENNKEEKPPDEKITNDQKRLEPPVPQEPESKVPESDIKVEPNADLDPQALQKEDKEIQKDDKEIQKDIVPLLNSLDISKKEKNIEKQENILRKLEQQHNEQKLILEAQKKVLEELKLHKESHEEHRKAVVENIPPVIPVAEKVKILPPAVKKPDITNQNVVKVVPDVNLKPLIETLPHPNDIPNKQTDKDVKYSLVQNLTKEDPLKKLVLNTQRDTPKTVNENIPKVKQTIIQNPVVDFTRNKTSLNLEKTIDKKVIKNPSPGEFLVQKTTPKVLVEEPPKIVPAVLENLNDPSAHIIKRETLGQEEEIRDNAQMIKSEISLSKFSVHNPINPT